MHDRLPPELLDRILEIANSPTKGVRREIEYGKVLRVCSLVSHGVRERAQALLWRDIVLFRSAQVQKLLQVIKQGKVGHLRRTTLSLEWRDYALYAVESLEELVQLFPYLQVLRLSDWTEGSFFLPPPFSSFGLATTASLSSLNLCFLKISETTLFPPLPKLNRLVLRSELTQPDVLSRLLRPSTFPSLRALACGRNSADHLIPFFPNLPENLLAPLQEFQVNLDISYAPVLPTAVCKSPLPLLLTVSYTALVDLLKVSRRQSCIPRHILLTAGMACDAPEERSIEPLTTLLSTFPLDVRSLHLPTQLLLSNLIRDDLYDLLDRCEVWGIEVVWRADEQGICDSFSESFMRYSRRMKLEEKAQQEKAEEEEKERRL